MRSGTYWTVCLSVIRFAKHRSIYRDTETTQRLKTDTNDFSVVKCTELKGLRGVYPKFQTDFHPLNTRAISSRDRTLFQVWLKALQLGSLAPGPNTEPHHAMRASSHAHAKAGAWIPINGPHPQLTQNHQPLTVHGVQSTKHKAQSTLWPGSR